MALADAGAKICNHEKPNLFAIITKRKSPGVKHGGERDSDLFTYRWIGDSGSRVHRSYCLSEVPKLAVAFSAFRLCQALSGAVSWIFPNSAFRWGHVHAGRAYPSGNLGGESQAFSGGLFAWARKVPT